MDNQEIDPETVELDELPAEIRAEIITYRLGEFLKHELQNTQSDCEKLDNLEPDAVLCKYKSPSDALVEKEPSLSSNDMREMIWRIRIIPKINSKKRVEENELVEPEAKHVILEQKEYQEAIEEYRKETKRSIQENPEIELIRRLGNTKYAHKWPSFKLKCRLKDTELSYRKS